MLWVCLQFPDLPLDAVRQDECGREQAAVVMDGPLRSPRIVLANAAAHSCGIRAGQSLAAARALHPELLAWRRDTQAEQQMLTTLADWAYQFSAEVSLAPPRALLIEIGASLRLFDGWKSLEQRLRRDLAELGCSYRLALAPVATGARVLAGIQDGIALANLTQLTHFLGDISISNCGLERKTSSHLSAMGLRRLKQVFGLPRPELNRRIGAAALLHLDRMRGLAPEVRVSHHPAARFSRRLEFDYRIENVQGLLFPLQRLLRELGFFLVARDVSVQRFELVLEHERQATTRIAVGMLNAQREPSVLLELARTRLERVEWGASVHALSLFAEDFPTLRPAHEDLFESNANETLDWPSLVERLRSRLGDESVHALAAVADHRPTYAWRRQVLGREQLSPPKSSAKQALAADKRGVVSSAQGRRPLWLLRKAIPLRQRPLRILAGPERIESGWWDVDQRHDYYIVQTQAGQQAWAYVAAGATENWMLQGWFA